MNPQTWIIVLLAGAVALGCTDDGAGPETGPGPSFDRGGHPRHGWNWSEPVNLGPTVNSVAQDDNASLSPDELRLYLTSTRAGGQGGRDIWVARRASRGSPWTAAVNLGAVINTAGDDAGPTLSADGHRLFFFSDRPGSFGDTDIYVSYRADPDDDFAWEAPVNLGPLVNTDGRESGVELVPVRQGQGPSHTLLFNRRPVPRTAEFDLYSVPIGPDGLPTAPPAPIVELNTASAELGSSLSDDPLELVFVSNRPGTLGGNDIWISTRATLHDSWSEPQNLGAPVNTAGADLTPSLSANGRALIFAADRPGGIGDRDLWMAVRDGAGDEEDRDD